MKKRFLRVVSSLLVVVMIVGAAPISGFVGLDLPNWADLFTIKADAATYSGKCGDSLTWSLEPNTGVLTISGTGDMYGGWDHYFDVPWNGERSSIKTVVIGDCVTSIGNLAFKNCTSLTSITVKEGNPNYSSDEYGVLLNKDKTLLIQYPIGNTRTSYTIPDSVTSIGYEAFYRCTRLTSVTIPDSVTSIGRDAFYGCTSLTSVTIPDSVTSIGNSAFVRCTGLTSVTIPDSVTSIGSGVFGSCTSLTSVTIPDSVTSIGGSAFYECTSLTSVTIPDSVTSIGREAFYNTEIYNNASNWKNDILYIGNHLIEAKTSITGDYLVKSGTKTIADSAFKDCTSLTSVTIGNSVTGIGSEAFRGCTSLTSVTIGDSVTSIGSEAFRGCTSLTSVTIGDSVTSIGSYVFAGCTSLTSVTIGDSVTSIGSYVFAGCTSLTSVTIGDSVTSIGREAFYNTEIYNNASNWKNDVLYIGNHLIKAKTSITGNYLVKSGTKTIADYAFYNCTRLTSVTIPDSVTSIGESAFEDCTSLTSVTIGNSVTSIGRYAFEDCTSLTSVTIGDSVTSIGDYAFSGCASLTSVTIPDSVTSIGEWAFHDCTSLISITIPDSVISIGNCAFHFCTSLTSVTIPDSVKSIGDRAFDFCPSLTSITIPDSVTSIGSDAFEDCTSLTSITVNEGNPNYSSDEYGVLLNKDKTLLIQYPVGNTRTSYTIPDSVTSIGYEAFYRCTSLTSVTIPDSVTSIGGYAFWKCTSLTSVTIPDSVTIIGGAAFNECTSLTSVTIPDSVTSIGSWVFGSCTSLTSVTIPDSVTIIGGAAFVRCTGLTSVTIPDSVTSIGDRAFSGCASLTSVTIGDSVTSIGSDAFRGCTSLTSVTIPDSVTSIGDYAFSGCASLTSVTIPDSVTSIGYHAFYYCTSLTSVTIGNSVTGIGSEAFRGCTSLTSVTIPDSVTSIGSYVFAGCTSLTSVTIPDSVTRIGEWAFRDCTSLISVSIPDSVTGICSGAFYDCTSLTDVYYTGTQEQWKKISIGSDNGYLTSATIHFGSSLNYSQKHTVSGYAENNARYEYVYFGGKAAALDGSKGMADLCIPGLKNGDNMVPQGVAYYAKKNWLLLSSYYKDAKTDSYPCMLFALDFDTGELAAEYKLKNADGSTFSGHVGGIAVSDYNLYITDNKNSGISYVSLSQLDKMSGELIIEDTKSMTSYLGSAVPAYLSIDDGMFITGNFFYAKNSSYDTPAKGANSVILAQNLSGKSSADEWSNFCAYAPFATVKVPDSVDRIQGAVYRNDKFYLSSSLGRTNTSTLYIADVDKSNGYSLKNIQSYKALPMMEDMEFIGDHIYTAFESAAAFYHEGLDGGKVSKHPTDVVWRIDYKALIGEDSVNTVTGDVENATVHFVQGGATHSVNVSFKQNWFKDDSLTYNHNLAKLTSQYAMLGYSSATSYNSIPSLENALKTIGMNHVEIAAQTGKDDVNYFIASRKVTVDSKEYDLVFIGLIGSYHEQWYSNFDPGTGAVHQGFLSAKQFAYDALTQYINAKGFSKDSTKILITGHSRGAATANLLAADLIKSEAYAKPENIYTYAFATPNSTSLPERKDAKFKRIYNIVNPEDFVTKCLPAEWDYGRYGQTYTLPSKTNTSSSGYSKYKSNMQYYYDSFTNGEIYKPYSNGEADTRRVVDSLISSVDNIDEFYKKKLWVHSIPMSTYDFFQNSLCHVVSKEADLVDWASLAAIADGTLTSPISSRVFKEILIYFLMNGTGLNPCFENAHKAGTYCAYMMSMTESQVKQPRQGYKNTVNCPVNITVIDNETEEVVGKITDNIIDETVAAKENAIVMSVDGDSKSFWLPADGDYEVILTGNDTGTMDYTVCEVDSDIGETERVNFYGVEITDGKTMTGEVTGEDFTIDNYTLEVENGETIAPTEQSDETKTVQVSTAAGAGGTVSESIEVISGDYVSVYATPEGQYTFDGWYVDGVLVSKDTAYSFVAKENISLTAKFKAPFSLSVGLSDRIRLNYKASASLNTDIKVGDGIGYTVEYTSSNPSVVSVDKNGNVYGARKGSAEITVTVTDEFGYTQSAVCTVTVKYTWWQWLLRIFLFGWLWY